MKTLENNEKTKGDEMMDYPLGKIYAFDFDGTLIESKDGRLSGRFLTKNCYGREKVNRLLQLFPERKDYWLTAYGDSRGDYELLDFANEGHYKPFR